MHPIGNQYIGLDITFDLGTEEKLGVVPKRDPAPYQKKAVRRNMPNSLP